MLSSLYAGVMGLRNEQTQMDVIGNNIANINTVGFKAGRARFAETFSQLLQGASPGGNGLGGTNPIQLGLGSAVAGIDNLFTQGSLQTTGLGTDLAIQGDGFFILNDGKTSSYSRDGAFTFDAQGRLVDGASGRRVQGYAADATGNIAPGTSLAGIQIPLDATSPANPTTAMVLHGNLDASAAAGAVQNATATVYDSLGQKHTVTLTFTKSATPPAGSGGEWDVSVTMPATDGTVDATDNGASKLVFKTDGTLDTSATGSVFKKLTFTPAGNGAKVTIDFTSAANAGAFTSMSQAAGDSTASVFSQDGYAAGLLSRTVIDNQGDVMGTFTNGVTRRLAQLGLARFSNSQGLMQSAGNNWVESTNSGRAVVGTAGVGAFGTISAGALEGSNVDLAQQFTDLIVAQRGFQANAKIITTGDEMLTDVVNIKR